MKSLGVVSKARVVITAMVVEGRSQAEVARSYGVSKGWVSKLVARYRAGGEAAFEPRSRRPRTSPNAIDADTVELIVRLRKELADQGLDAGSDTIAWHLQLPSSSGRGRGCSGSLISSTSAAPVCRWGDLLSRP
ncbi:helix-turn-helix domain-containing protein [Nonomuraea sp. NPDC000554]|uniref:helix-turn-helix domain-containing protein n=1 Tax=Nonomuraea sp. NPDC000554 TaxID=3154259 RepID=UPI00332FFE4E